MGFRTEKEPTVPKAVYDDLLTRYDALMERYHSLRQAGFVPRATTQPPVRLPDLDPEHAIVERASREFVERATKDWMAQGKTESEARAIAQTLADAVTAASPAPSF